ncbi:MAG: hypothetical protein PWP23_2130 [Candidatus Sumerlaeota bacterium]|nr:hypothetical protein [Candidatus Sumerlaeota bacterium]
MALATVAASLLLEGCTVGPDYSPPDLDLPSEWISAESGDEVNSNAEELAHWWASFDDPLLTELVSEAIASNLDLQTALSRVREARLQAGITSAEQFPTLDASGSATQSFTRSRTENPATGKTVGETTDARTYRAGFDASWEVDVFGGVRRSVEASEHDYEAEVASYNDVLVSLTAEVATNYVAVRTYQARIRIAEENLAAQQESLELVEARHEAQISSELPVMQARSNLQTTQSQIPSLRASLNESMNRLAILLGELPGTLQERLEEAQPIPAVQDSVSIGVPSEALRCRPDIRQAEKSLAAQVSRVGVAVADLYPKFMITGAVSRQGEGTKGFRELATDTLSFGPNMTWRVFDRGQVKNTVKLEEERADQLLLAFRSSVLSAMEEVENKLTSVERMKEQRAHLQTAVESTESVLELARAQYEAGQVSFSEVIDAQQSLLSLQDNLAQTESEIVTETISLYKAAGGGWDAPSDLAFDIPSTKES